MRDITLASTEYFKFTTKAFSTNIPTTLLGTPVVSVYEENNLVQITSGVTLTVDYDGVTGLNDVSVAATAANGYEIGKTYHLVITAGTVDSVSVVGDIVGEFSVQNQYPSTTLVDDIWNESLAAHQTALTAGRAATLGGVPIAETTATGTPTSTSIRLTAGSTVDNYYNNQVLKILSGSGAGQARPIVNYTGATKTCTFDEALAVVPSAGDVVAVEINHIHPVSEIAAAVASYNMGNGRTIEESLHFLRNKWTIINGVLTVYLTDDTTVSWTSALTTTAGNPVSSSDPT